MRCCFHIAMIFGTGGEHALEGGWTTRAERLLDDLGDDAVEHGYDALLHMYRHLGSGDLPPAVAAAASVSVLGRRHRDPDLLALGLCCQGRLAIHAGRIADGLALLDESMAGAAARELTAVVFGHVSCTAIEGCQEIADFGHVAEWTSVLHRWCLAQTGLVAFTGQCSVHRGQLMRVRGAWPEALEEFESAIERYRRADSLAAVGFAECERGDVLRQSGEFAAAETAYQRASEHDSGGSPASTVGTPRPGPGRPGSCRAGPDPARRTRTGTPAGPSRRGRGTGPCTGPGTPRPPPRPAPPTPPRRRPGPRPRPGARRQPRW